MIAHCLERIAASAALMPVVDEEGDPAILHKPLRDGVHGSLAGGGKLDDLAVGIEREPAGSDRHSPLDAVDMLADRERVEELVRHEQHRLCQQVTDEFME